MENTIPSGVRLAQPGAESAFSAVSWGAIIAGAVVASVISLCLLLLGTGLGLTAISPWAGEGANGKAAGIVSMVWVVFMQITAAVLGGYIAGRLRVKWTGLDHDEVVFRDTAHGFLTWALGTIIAASFLASAATAVVGTAANVGGAAAKTAATTAAVTAAPAAAEATKSGEARDQGPNAGILDMLFRSTNPQSGAQGGSAVNARAETGRILGALREGSDMQPDDRAYLSKLIAANTGVSEQEAEKRIADAQERLKAREAQVRQAADEARKAAIQGALGAFIGLLIGAFASCLAAVRGGRERDQIHTT